MDFTEKKAVWNNVVYIGFSISKKLRSGNEMCT